MSGFQVTLANRRGWRASLRAAAGHERAVLDLARERGGRAVARDGMWLGGDPSVARDRLSLRCERGRSFGASLV